LFDGVTYLALIVVLSQIDLREAMCKQKNSKPLKALAEGLHYVFETPLIRFRILQLLTAIGLLYPLMAVVLRTYIQKKFSLDAGQFGYVFTIPSLGSMMGAFSFAIFKPNRPLRLLFIGIPAAIVTIFAVPLCSSLEMSTAWMGLSGFFTYLSFAALTVSLQLEVDEEFRGRLGSVIGLSFVGFGPMMAFPVGLLSDWLGPEMTIFGFSTLCAILSALLYTAHKSALHMALTPSLPVRVELVS
jgi:hypothetical protein